MVYVIVAAGLATTVLPVVALKLVPGLHVYVVAPLAVSVAESPGQIPGLVGVITKVGVGVILTMMSAVSAQPEAFVPTRV